jgi:hypothetical protein
MRNVVPPRCVIIVNMKLCVGHLRAIPRLLSASSLVLCFALGLQAQMQMNVEQLADFIRSELALQQHTDKQIAAYVKKIQLTEKLTDKTILDLEAQKAGPKTVQALQELRDQTAALKPPTRDATYSPATAPDNALTSGPATITLASKAPPIPPPNSVRQKEILDQIKQYAMTYTQSLPNFICVEVTRRYIDPNASDHYRSIGSVLAKLSYNEGQEKYEVYSVNGHYENNTTMEHANTGGGAISTGEFGSLMREIFEPHSEAEFGWDHWATLRGRRMAVFNYFIDSGHSSYSITYGSGPGDEQRIITAYKGLIYADENTGEITRIKFIAMDIPKSFPVSEAAEILDYDQAQISGQPYIVPMMAQLYMTAGRDKTKNELEFRSYRKFGVESGIKYGAADIPPPLPSSQTEEQPVTAAPSASTTASAPSPDAPPPAKTAKSGSASNPWVLPSAPPPPPTRPPQ